MNQSGLRGSAQPELPKPLLRGLGPHAPAGPRLVCGGFTPLSPAGLHPGTAERRGVSQVHPQEQRQHAQCRQPHPGTRAASERSVTHAGREPLQQCGPEAVSLVSMHAQISWVFSLDKKSEMWDGMDSDDAWGIFKHASRFGMEK